MASDGHEGPRRQGGPIGASRRPRRRREQVRTLLFERDPIGLNFESNTDEYRSEAETIALRFLGDASVLDPGLIVYEEFVRWFGSDVCGPRERYDSIGRELWEIWAASRS